MPDFNTPIGQVRALLSDVDDDNPYLLDEQIQVYLELSDHTVPQARLLWAAAQALRALAINEGYVKGKTETLDVKVDASVIMAQMNQLADRYEAQAQQLQTRGTFNGALSVFVPQVG